MAAINMEMNENVFSCHLMAAINMEMNENVFSCHMLWGKKSSKNIQFN